MIPPKEIKWKETDSTRKESFKKYSKIFREVTENIVSMGQ